MFENIILQNIVNNHTYGADFVPYLKPSLFNSYESKIIFNHLNSYFHEYSSLPHWNEIIISISNDNKISEDGYNRILNFVNGIKTEEKYNSEWLSNETKKWIRNAEFKNVITEAAIKIDSNEPFDDMMQKVKEVFAINFNESIGNSLFRDFEKQHDYYTQVKEKFESHLSILNTICDGGVERKTLNLLMAPTNTGKTSAMISLACGYLRRGYNVLYITCEMSENNIRQRIDANFLKIPINDIPRLSKEFYCSRMQEMSETYKSNLYVKEYPTASANANHIRGLLDALATKEKFFPDIVIVDYINILTSTRVKQGKSYEIIKSIAEELRGLFSEYNVCGWSATQTNRDGDGASDLDLTDVSESYGLPMTVDMMIAIIQTPALLEQFKQIWKLVKTRYSSMKGYKFIVDHDFNTCTVSDSQEQKIPSATKPNSDDDNLTVNKFKNQEKLKNFDIDFD